MSLIHVRPDETNSGPLIERLRKNCTSIPEEVEESHKGSASAIILSIIEVIIGILVILTFINSLYGFLIGVLMVTCGNLAILIDIYQKFLKD